MGERVGNRELSAQKENHGRLVRLTYHRNKDGTVDVLQTPSPISLVASCPSERKFLQDTYSRPAYLDFYQWLEAGKSTDLEVLSRDAHTGWVEVTSQGIVHVIKDIPTHPFGWALDVIGGAVKVEESMKDAALREFAEETVLVDLKKGKLLAPDVDLDLLTELIYQHFLHANTLHVDLPPNIMDIIDSARRQPSKFVETIPTHIPPFEGSENLVRGKFRSELDGKVDEMDGIITVHPDGLNVMQPLFIPTDLQALRIADLECLQSNKDEKARALRRQFTVLNTANLRAYLNGQEVEVPILGTTEGYISRISSSSHGIKNLGLAFAQTVTRMH